jgi:hypothetical protein
MTASLNNALKTQVFLFLVSHHTPCEEAPFLSQCSTCENNRYQSSFVMQNEIYTRIM